MDTIRPRSAPARRGLNRIDGNAPITRRPDSYFSYLKERATLVRNADTFPFLTVMSILVTSAMRISRMDFAAVSTARLAASSQETVLTPTTSTIL